MKAVILAGGLGTRLEEETVIKPKPMVEIGDRPILWHIMKLYSHFGIKDFVVCLGYKGYVIKEYFLNYALHNSDLSIDLESNSIKLLNKQNEPWNITLVDTGSATMTGGRLKRIAPYINEQNFLMTYGDGLCNVDVRKLIDFHLSHKKLATVTAVRPSGRFGVLDLKDNQVARFEEKPKGDGGYINGGFFVLDRKVFEYIENDSSIWEKEPLENLVKDNQLMAYKHEGFWHAMDTIRDKKHLQNLWEQSDVPWKVWD